VYLSGPIDNASDFGVGWRGDIKNSLVDLDLIFLDPCDKPMLSECACEDLENHDLRRRMKENEDFEGLARDMRLIRCIDLRLADLCDFAIVHLDLDVYSTGTHEEVSLLNRRKVPILFHVEQGKASLPDWYWGTVPHQHVFGTWGSLLSYIYKVAYSPETVDTYNRWRFLDYGALYNKRTLAVSGGREARVSPEDHTHLSQWKWSSVIQNKNLGTYRAMRKYQEAEKGVTRYMHQEVGMRMGFPPETLFDHRDRDPLNNVRENLRVVSQSENLHNRGPQVNNTSGVKGVWTRNGWHYAEIVVKGIKYRLGKYESLEEAKSVRDAAEKELVWGETI
jgi:hypothetical protein